MPARQPWTTVEAVAGFRSLGAVGLSITRLLTAEFARAQPMTRATTPVLIRTNDLALTDNETLILPPAISVLAYRVDFNKVTRPAWSATGYDEGRSYLPLDVRFLLTAWAENAENELHIIGRALQAIDNSPILAGPMLHPTGEWAEHETVELVLEDVPTEDLMRIFDSLNVDYRLTVPVIARVVVVSGLDNDGWGDVQTVVQGIKPPDDNFNQVLA
jgi:hypothetical protein